MPICPMCDESYEPSDRDLPEGFCEPCAEVADNSVLFAILREQFDATVVAVIFK
jgi:hypothetical protein